MTTSSNRPAWYGNPLAQKSLFVALIMATLLFVGCSDPEKTTNSGTPTSATPTVASTTNAPTSTEGSIKAEPNPVPAGGDERGKTKVSWTTKPDVGAVNVYISEGGQPEALFATSPEGSQEAPWILAGRTYEFRLYTGTGSNRKLIDKVIVTR